jgi:hypothetical protein
MMDQTGAPKSPFRYCKYSLDYIKTNVIKSKEYHVNKWMDGWMNGGINE